MSNLPALPAPTGRAWIKVAPVNVAEALSYGARRYGDHWHVDTHSPAVALLAWTEVPLADLDRTADGKNSLPGEDRSRKVTLTACPVPASAWLTDLHAVLDLADEADLARYVSGRAGGRCEGCRQDLLAYRWSPVPQFSYAGSTMTLTRLLALCVHCHAAVDPAFAERAGLAEAAIQWRMQVTGETRDDVIDELEAALVVWAERSMVAWEIDTQVLANGGVRVFTGRSAALADA